MADVLTSEGTPPTPTPPAARTPTRWDRHGPPPPVRWVLQHPQAADALLGVVLAVAAIGALVGHDHPSYEVTPLLVVLALASALPLVVRRRAPMAVLLVVATAQVGLELAGADGPGWLAAMLAAYTVASRSPAATPRRILIGVGVAAVPVTVAALVADVNPAVFLPSFVVVTLVMIVGDRVRRGRELSREISAQAAEQQRHEAEQALQDERRRIARELHDVVAHSVSAMIIQAAAARRQLTANPDQASQALLDVEATGRTAMHEMRRVLGVLRGDEPALALGPQPSLLAIADLVEAASDLPVRFECAEPTELDDVPAAVGLSVYRVVQEALTNVRRHAGPVRAVVVSVRRQPGQLVVEVVDDGRGASVSDGSGGFGLIGMRERVAMFDGTLVAGPRTGGGWRVRATLPLDGGLVTIRVVLVDDQAMVRAGFRMILESEPDLAVVGEAADGRDAADLVARARPDVVLMDVRMPHVDGIEATRRIHAAADPPRVLMLTTFDLDDYVYAALRAGASGFLLKDAPAEQLVDAVRVIARGDALLAPSVTRRLIEEVARRPNVDATAVPGLDELTDREREVLQLMARGLSNAEIAERLYLGEATVKTHVGRVLTKLGLRDRVQAVVVAYESGLVTPGAPAD